MKRNQNENYIPFITFYLASMPKLIISFYSPIFLKYQEIYCFYPYYTQSLNNQIK